MIELELEKELSFLIIFYIHVYNSHSIPERVEIKPNCPSTDKR